MTNFSSPLSPAQPRVLLITTDPVMTALATPALESSGFRVSSARGASEALARATRSAPDVVLLNLLVDEADALSLRELIRRVPHCSSIPIFVISDLFDQGLIAKVYQDAFSQFLPQPVNWHVLPHRIRQAIAMGRTVTELDRYQKHLEQAQDAAQSASTEALKLRNFDELTELPNRATFSEIVSLAARQMKNRPGETAVLFINVDRFKELNDSLGRDGGDALLKAIAGRLKSTLEQRVTRPESEGREMRASVARIHADEFAILLDQMGNRSQVEHFAQELLAAVTAPYSLAGRDVFVSASLGIALGSESTEEAILQCAETAMRHSKRAGGRSVCFYTDSMKDEVVERLELQERLRPAIDRDELTLHYQPLIHSQSGRISAVEALVRWTDPDRGAISPAVFIPIAEESDLIISIGDWVLREALSQMSKWTAKGLPPIRMAVNIGRAQLEEESFVAKVEEAISAAGVPSRLVEFELSERGVLRDDPLTLDKLRRINELGIALAIDDFGTGQTTLAYLQSFPLSVLKIDRSFVARVDNDPATEAIIRAMIAMSHELDLRVVGEGIETEYQATVLCGLQCDELQGFLFHRPMPPEDVEDLLRSQAAEPEYELVPEALATRTLGPLVDHAADPFPQVVTATDRASQDELFRLAHVDFLTSLLNRYSFESALESTLARAQRFGHKVALLIFDLDQFKEVNDTYGHAAGDELLTALAHRMKRAVRQVDSLARLGGDEFALIHSEFKSLDGVATLAQRILDEIARPVDLSVGEVNVSASTGIAVFPPGDSDPKRFFTQADLALYKSKDQGGACFHFHAHEMDQQVQLKFQLGRDLKEAIARDELHLVFQPQFSLATRDIVAVETLVRWNHPKRGLIPPATFIPVAEDTGEIIRIGEWVLRQACSEARAWQTQLGLELPVSVNLSSVQFRLRGFPKAVKRILAETELKPDLLELELNQQVLLRLESDLERLTRGLAALGVGLCVDDFGTSPFSIEDLSHLPFSKLKVDGRHIHTSNADVGCPPLVCAMIAMGKKLNLGIVAEAVESQVQLSALKEAGCDFGQGNFFTKPMTADELRIFFGANESKSTTEAQVLRFPPG